VRIDRREIGRECRPYVIAEIGVNHDGDPERALAMVASAAEAGADAVKMQCFEADRLMSRAAKLAMYQKEAGERDPVEMLKRLELSLESMGRVVEAAHSLGLHAIVTIFSLELSESAVALGWDAYKVGSADVVNIPLIEKLAEAGKPLIISTGAATEEEIASTVPQYGDVFLHCVSSYPTPLECTHLAGIAALADLCREVCGSTVADSPTSRPIPVVGYSDHTPDVETGALAVAVGACVLEKHMTHDRTAVGPDHAASLEPGQFAEYVRLCHEAWERLGPRRIVVQDGEQDVRAVSRQSITTTRLLEPGHVLTRDDLTIKRPGTGLAPGLLDRVVGRVVCRSVEGDMPLVEEDVEGSISGEGGE